jgi:hypothetical protein
MARKGVRQLQQVADSAVRIRCRYCDIKDECPVRTKKESYENENWMTRCSLTPNRPGKKKK